MTARARRAALRAILLGQATVTWLACGTDVDLGGSSEASQSDAAAPDALLADGGGGLGAVCDPCTSAQDCVSSTECARISADSGNAFCIAPCPTGSGCTVDETCRSLPTAAGPAAKLCAPTSGTCVLAVGPAGSDGAPLEKCGVLNGPLLASPCRTCEYDCQRNGCYGGWWCNTLTKRCERPPRNCP